jgi:NAD(P)-dependent dehydrogenase (short-subunit alcohol dehydrogenase family)
MSGRVAGKVALITGAARGQGRADALRLAEEGADVIVVDVCAPLPSVPYDSATPEDLAETVSLIEKTGRRVISGIVDVRDLDRLRGIVDGAVRQLVRAGGGSVILISSAAGIKVQPFMVPYTTSKFAVRGMAKAFAAELGQHNIRVNSVHPTGVNTPMGSGNMQAEIGAAIAGYDRLGAMFINMLPVESTEPEDVADTVLFLASDESKFITAHEMAPDAGVTEF